MKTKIFKQGIQTIIPFTILLFIIVFGFVSCDIIDPEKNCNETKKYKKTNHPSELILSYNEVDAYYTIKDICPENLLAITAKVNTKGNNIDDKVSSIKLIWNYQPWKTRYKDYIYLIRNQENPNQFVAAQVLLPYEIGFYIDNPAKITFNIELNLYDWERNEELFNWLKNNINNFEFEVEYIKF